MPTSPANLLDSNPDYARLSLFSDVTGSISVDSLETESHPWRQTDDLTLLGHEILDPWTRYPPRIVTAVAAQNPLMPAIFADTGTHEQFAVRTDAGGEDGFTR